MKRLFNKTPQFVSIYDGLVNENDCKSVIETHNNNNTITIGTIGTSTGSIVDFSARQSLNSSYPADAPPQSHIPILNALSVGIRKYCETYPDADRVDRFGIYERYNVQYYKPTWGYHITHSERMGLITAHRHLVWMVYLNTVTDGGETVFPLHDFSIRPRSGRLVIWPSDWMFQHHGNPSKTQEKYIMTGWYSYYTPQ